jgi:hypothetical protein
MDETMVAYNYVGKRGTVVNAQYWKDINATLLHDCVGASAAKTNMSLLACIASDHIIQGHLPQILKANKKKFPVYLIQIADELLPPTSKVTIDVGDSIWSTQEFFEVYIKKLAASLDVFKETHGFVLVVDASTTHINDSIAQVVFNLGILLVFIPGGLTWLLQPLDVYIFGPMKTRLRERLHEARMLHANGLLTKDRWLSTVLDEVGRLNTSNHSRCFERLGLSEMQNQMRAVDKQKIVTQQQVDDQEHKAPTSDELADLLGRVNVPFYATLTRVYHEQRVTIVVPTESQPGSSSQARA